MTTKNIIVAMGESGGIGYKGALPWEDYNDLDWFKKMTEYDSVLMGRKTWESIPYDKLSNRRVYVLSGSHEPDMTGDVRWFNCLCRLPKIESECGDTLWIAGGESVYNYFYETDQYDNVFWTRFGKSYAADCHFPWAKICEETEKIAQWSPENDNFPSGTYREIRS